MDDMTWMSSFYEPPPQPSRRHAVRAFWMTVALLAAMGCGGVMLATWPQPSAPASPAEAHAGPVP